MNVVPATPVIRNVVSKALCATRPCNVRPLRARTLLVCCAVTVDTKTGSRKRLRANGLHFVVDDQGPTGAAPVVLLHGFPNRANLWERQIPALLESGFRVIAPDLRGAINGESDAPQDVQSYNISKVLVKDVAGIMDALEIDKAHIVGHDWGSSLAWAFASLYPDRTLTLVGMSVGNPTGYFKGDHANEQKLKSWYIAFFSLRSIAEWALASGKLFAEGAGPKEAAAVEAPMVKQLGMLEGMDKPQAWTSGLNWYRANAGLGQFLSGSLAPSLPPVTCDVLQLWFTGDDPVCSEGQAKSSGQYVKSPGTFRYERLESPSHFAPWTDPEPVSASLLSFLKKS